MIMSIDLFAETVELAYSTGPDHSETSILYPRRNRTVTDPSKAEDPNALRRFLNELRADYADTYSQQIEATTIVIPFDMPYPRRCSLKQLAAQAGMGRVRLMYATECAVLSDRSGRRMSGNEVELCCRMTDTCMEYGLLQPNGSIIDVWGVTGTRFLPNEIQSSRIKRIVADLTQLMRDALGSTGRIAHVVCIGMGPGTLSERLRELTGCEIEYARDATIRGALMMSRILVGAETDTILLRSTPADIWMKLGELGEAGIAVSRYLNYPLRIGGDQALRLLVSTQSLLTVYEGNYSNPRYDTPISSFDLSSAREGHEIVCHVDIDAEGELCLTVLDDEGRALIYSERLCL